MHPIRILRHYGFVRGVLGGSRPWIVVAGLLWFARNARSLLGRTPEVAACEVLRPGESIVLTALAPARKGRRIR